MTGGAIGSLFAQFFHLTAAERKTLLVAGAAAGMTAIFGTPVAAVLLAVELLLFEWQPRSFIPGRRRGGHHLGGMAAAAVRRRARCSRSPNGSGAAVVGPGPLRGPGRACAGLQSGLLTKMLYACEDAFERLPIHWMWWPVMGGVGRRSGRADRAPRAGRRL